MKIRFNFQDTLTQVCITTSATADGKMKIDSSWRLGSDQNVRGYDMKCLSSGREIDGPQIKRRVYEGREREQENGSLELPCTAWYT